MARIPDITALGDRPIPQPGGPRAVDQSGAIIAEGIQRLGNTLEGIADQREERQALYDVSNARTALLKADIDARSSLSQDNDWQTYEQRYAAQMQKAQSVASAQIRNKLALARFEQESSLDIERGIGQIREMARSKEVDTGRATLLTNGDQNRELFMQALDEETRAAILRNQQAMLEGATAKNYISDAERASFARKWAQDAAEGWVSMQPYAKQIEVLSKPKGTTADYILADKREEMLQHAILAKQVEEQRALALQKQQQEEAQKATQNAFLERMQDGKLTPQDVLHSNLAPFGSGSKDEFLTMLKAGSGGGKTDPATFNDLFTRIHLPPGSPGKIANENQLNAYVSSGRLSIEDLNKLRNEVQGNNTSEGESEGLLKKGLFEVAKNTLTRSNPLLGIQDPIGEENLQRFNAWFLGEYQKQRESGKTPQQLLSPDSPDYLGKRLSSYVRSPQQILQDAIGSASQAPATKAPARKQGETPDEYLKRIGKK